MHIPTATRIPERRYLASELTPAVRLNAALSVPNRRLRFNVLYLHWIAWPFRHVLVLLYPSRNVPRFVTARLRYLTAEKARVCFVILLLLQFRSAFGLCCTAYVRCWALLAHTLS